MPYLALLGILQKFTDPGPYAKFNQFFLVHRYISGRIFTMVRSVVFSERELTFTFAICRRPSVCRLSVCLSACLSSVTFVRPTQGIEIFGNVFMPFGTLAICELSVKILRRSSQWNPAVRGGVNRRRVAKYSNFGPFQGYISETVQNRR